MTNSIIDISEVEVQLPERWIALHLYVYMYKCWETAAYASFSPNINFSWETLTNKNKHF